jgi:hypothetical protein
MTKDEAALKSFYLLSQVSKLLTLAFNNDCDFTYRIKAQTTPGSPILSTEDDLPKLTGGYEVHIIIHPPATQSPDAQRIQPG